MPEICPACYCQIGDICVIKDGVAYCCKGCATGGVCECGCYTVAEPQPEAIEGEGRGSAAGQ